MTEECRRKIVELARQGMSDVQIADVVHYAPLYIRQIRIEEGVLRDKTGNRKYPADKIRQLITEGKSNRQIAKEIGCHTTLASYYRRKMGKNHAPTVDAVPVRHGKWIIRDNPRTGWYRVTCSECGEDVTSTAPCIGFFPNAKVVWDYCPYCGARMDEE